MEPHNQFLRATHFWHELAGRPVRFGDLHEQPFSMSLLARMPELRRALMVPSPSIRLAVMQGAVLLRVLDARQTYEHIKLARSLDEYTP